MTNPPLPQFPPFQSGPKGQTPAPFQTGERSQTVPFQTGERTRTPLFQNNNGVSTDDLSFFLRLMESDRSKIGRYNGTYRSFQELRPNQQRYVASLMQGSEDARSQMPRRTLIALHARGSQHRDGAPTLQNVITIHVHDDLEHGARSILNATRLHTSTYAEASMFVIRAADLVTGSGYAFDHLSLMHDLRMYGGSIKAAWYKQFQQALNDLTP